MPSLVRESLLRKASQRWLSINKEIKRAQTATIISCCVNKNEKEKPREAQIRFRLAAFQQEKITNAWVERGTPSQSFFLSAHTVSLGNKTYQHQ